MAILHGFKVKNVKKHTTEGLTADVYLNGRKLGRYIDQFEVCKHV